MLQIKKEGIIVRSTGLGFEKEGVLNPAIVADGNKVHVFYRAVAAGNYSSIGYAQLKGPVTLAKQYDKPVIFPQSDHENNGTEDPRIVKIEGTYYITYTAYDGVNALGALATSDNLETFDKLGLITPQIQFSEFKRLAESKKPLNEKYIRYNKRDSIRTKHLKQVFVWVKNVVFFPRRIGGKLWFMIRIKPDIQLVSVYELKDLTQEFWEDYFHHFDENIVMEPIHPHEVSYIGAGCPPIETDKGWLIIYHGVHDSPKGYIYTACAALLDINDPLKEIARLPYPMFFPEFDYELKGEVNNVCFPTGTALFGDTLYIYYGAADAKIACASVSLSALLKELLLNTTSHG
jgi:predicted GH43/DUF377 family glycosyl hydrolase